MPLTQVFDDTFTRANGPVGNSWVDATSVWTIASNIAQTSSAAFGTATLMRPASEYSGINDQQVAAKMTTSSSAESTAVIWLGKQSGSNSGYICWSGQNGSSQPVLAYARIDSGTLVGLDTTHLIPSGVTTTPVDVIVTFSVVGTTLTCSVALASAPGTPLVSFTKTDSTYSSGVVGLSPISSPNQVKEFTANQNVGTSSLAASPNTGVSGSGGIALTLTGSGGASYTPGTPGSPVFTTSLGTLVGQVVTSTTTATATLLPLYSGGNHVITDTLNGVVASVTITAPNATTKVVCAGNSLTAGQSMDGTAIPYPTLLKAILGPLFAIQNSGISSQTGSTILAGFSSQIGQYYDASKWPNILVLWEGTNDLYFNASPATAYGNFVAISSAWKALNWSNKTIVLTCDPRSNFPGTSTIAGTAAQQLATFEANRQAFNSLVRADGSHFDEVVDVASDQRIGFLGDEQNPAYFDGSLVHHNAAGYAIIADIVAGGILLGGSGKLVPALHHP